MIVRLANLILLGICSLIQAADVSTPISLTEVSLGGNVTIECNVTDKNPNSFHWYKQPLGHMVETIAIVIAGRVKKDDNFKSSRFTVTKVESQYSLTISNISKEDEASYFCHVATKQSQRFINGTFLAVKDQQHSFYDHQNLNTDLVQLGDFKILLCPILPKNKENKVQCPAEHNVHWFRTRSERFDPALVYSQNISKKNPESSCSYSFSPQGSSDAGTYYCAIASCGAILFGEGTKVETKPELDPIVITVGGLLVCCVFVIILLIIYIKNKQVFEPLKGEVNSHHHFQDDKSSVDQSAHLNCEARDVDYAAVQIRGKRGSKKRELSQECVYSSARSDHQHQPNKACS